MTATKGSHLGPGKVIEDEEGSRSLQWQRHLGLGTTAIAFGAIAPMVVAMIVARPWLVGLAAVPLIVLVSEIATANPPTLSLVASVENRVVSEGSELRVIVEVATSVNGVVQLHPISSEGVAGEMDSQSVLLDRSEPAVVELTGVATRWGSATVGLGRIDWRSRLGLISWQASVEALESVWVFPKPTKLRSRLGVSSTTIRSGPHRSRSRGSGVEYHSTRPFEQGDRWRDIDHKALAKTGEVWTRTRHAEQSRDVVVIVDLLDDGAEDSMQEGTLADQTLRAAEAVVQRHLSERDRVGVLVIGRRVLHVAPRDGRRQRPLIVDALVRARPRQPWGALGTSLDIAKRVPAGATVVVISPLLDIEIVDQVRALRRHGRDVVVVQAATDLITREWDSLKTRNRLAAELHELRAAANRARMRSERIPLQVWQLGEDPHEPIEKAHLLHQATVRRTR